MKFEYLQGFNDALIGLYLNPYNDKKEPAKFMEYHNGHNSGCWFKRSNTVKTTSQK